MARWLTAIALSVLMFNAAAAQQEVAAAPKDEVWLQDGSRVIGQVNALQDGKLTVKTDFAGDLSVDLAKVKGIHTHQVRDLNLADGRQVSGLLSYDAEKGQRLTAASGEAEALSVGQVSGLWAAGQRPVDGPKPPDWSARLEMGLNGQTGTKEKLAFSGRGELRRVTEIDRLLFYLQARYDESDGDRTKNEVFGGLDYEHDINERWFWFGKMFLEYDEIEELDLRARATAGLGYFLIKKAEQELKVRGGAGYQHEEFSTGDIEDSAVLELGYDYKHKLNEKLLFTHGITYYPTFEDIDDFRAVAETALEIALTNDDLWKMRLGMRNEYDNMPVEDVERLDTYYFLNLVLDFK